MRAAVWLQFLVCVGYTLFNSSLKIILKVPSVFNLLLGAQDLALSKGLHLMLGGTRGKVAAKYTARLIWRLFRWCLCAVVAHLMCKSDYSEKCRERSILWSVVFASGTRVAGTWVTSRKKSVSPRNMQKNSNPRNDPNHRELMSALI